MLAQEREKLIVVTDQVLSPTYTLNLAVKISQIMCSEYHDITNPCSCSWYEYVREFIKLTGTSIDLVSENLRSYPVKAKRPLHSVMENYHVKLPGMSNLPLWEDALNRCLVQNGLVT